MYIYSYSGWRYWRLNDNQEHKHIEQSTWLVTLPRVRSARHKQNHLSIRNYYLKRPPKMTPVNDKEQMNIYTISINNWLNRFFEILWRGKIRKSWKEQIFWWPQAADLSSLSFSCCVAATCTRSSRIDISGQQPDFLNISTCSWFSCSQWAFIRQEMTKDSVSTNDWF